MPGKLQLQNLPPPPYQHTDSPVLNDKSKQVQQQQQQQQHQAHREALRLALGSILTPKRPYTPSSRSSSSSGTASPAFSSHSMTVDTPPPPPPPPNSTPAHPHVHDYILHHHTHAHGPSRLGVSRTNSYEPRAADQETDLTSHPPHSLSVSTSPSPSRSPLPSPAEPALHAPVPLTASAPPSSEHLTVPVAHEGTILPGGSISGSGTPKAKFIETLQSKSAWDALIHGSFS